MDFKHLVEHIGLFIEFMGVGVVLVGALGATGWFLYRAATRTPLEAAYADFRLLLGRSILLGLEFMVAGDIIRTVAVDPSIKSVLVLAMIVLIRTFLSMTLEVELEGRWPWQRDRQEDAS